MTRSEFLGKVVDVYFRDNCSTEQAIQKVIDELKLTTRDFIDIMTKCGGNKNGFISAQER